jgi:thiamine biosynthesis lipoprotein
VSVEATSATLADALSTCLVLAPRAQIEALRAEVPEMHRITLVDADGNLVTL